jgi:hypothetical protein
MPKPRKPRPIIFISHSARADADAYPELKTLEKHLKKSGFDVLVDESRIQGGEPWRDCLHTWMGHCHGAVVLLTARALESPWVLKEATILAWRRSLSNGRFLLLPVFFGIRSTDLAKSQSFAPLALAEIEALKKLTGLPLAKAVAKLLDPLLSAIADTPQRELENKIAGLLSELKRPALLEKAARNLGQDLGGWRPNRDAAGMLAMLLLQAPMEKLAEGLGPLVGVLPKESLRSIIDMLRGSWVNRETAGMLALVARKARGTRAAALNATEQEFTATALIARASGSHPWWYSIPVSDASGEDMGGSLKAQVAAAVTREAGNPAAVDAFLSIKENRGAAVIVLPPPAEEQALPDDTVIQGLLSATTPAAPS